MNLTYMIYAVDPKDSNHKEIIGACFLKGLAKQWVEETITRNDLEIVNQDTGERWYYNQEKKKWL